MIKPSTLSDMPLSSPPTATPTSAAEFVSAAFDPQRFSGNQSFCYGAAGICQNPTVCVPGYRHHISSRFLIQLLKIRQPERFQLFYGHQEFSGCIHALGDKGVNGRIGADISRFFESGHRVQSPVLII
jgi:hypothetical protein